jgi:hypothetical protein
MLFYWVMFHRIFHRVQSLSNTGVLAMALTASVLLPVAYELATFRTPNWSAAHHYFGTHSGVDIAVVVLKYHPLAYVHMFVLGCCLPRLRSQAQQAAWMKPVLPYLASLGYATLILLFCTVGDAVPGYKLSFRLGMVSIVQAALLVGLCNPQDLLGRVFSHPVLKQLGNYGFAQYIFQFLAYAWYHAATGKNVVDIRYFLLLFSTAVLAHTSVRPFMGKNMLRFTGPAAVAFVAFLMLEPLFTAQSRASIHVHLSTASSANASAMVGDSALALPAWWIDKAFPIHISNEAIAQGKSLSLSRTSSSCQIHILPACCCYQVHWPTSASLTLRSATTTRAACSWRAGTCSPHAPCGGWARSTCSTGGRRAY